MIMINNDHPEIIRETLEYALKFRDSSFCLVIDAESFEQYDMAELAYDILLLRHSHQIRITIIVCCFSSATSKQKKRALTSKIEATKSELQKCMSEIMRGEFGSVHHHFLTTDDSLEDTQRHPIIIIPKNDDPYQTTAEDVQTVLSSLRSGNRPLAEKLIFISHNDGIFDPRDNIFLHQITIEEVQKLINKKVIRGRLVDIVETAMFAINNLRVRRVHLINGAKPGSLLTELFTKEGIGTMIFCDNRYHEIRPAQLSDITGIYSLLAHHASRGVRRKKFSEIREDLEKFIVSTIDGYIVGCACLSCFEQESKAFISSVAVSQQNMKEGIGTKMLTEIAKIARGKGMISLSIISSSATSWWMSQEFEEGDIKSLPEEIRQQVGNRTVKVLSKQI